MTPPHSGGVRLLLGVVPVSWWTVLVLLVGLVLALAGAPHVARRHGWRPRATRVLLVSVAGVVALTLTPSALHGPTDPVTCLAAVRPGVLRGLTELSHELESQLNALLLLPVGAALVIATRRAAPSLVAVVALPAVLELAQNVVPGRICSPADLVLNALGGAAGVALGVAGGRWRARTRPGRATRARSGPSDDGA